MDSSDHTPLSPPTPIPWVDFDHSLAVVLRQGEHTRRRAFKIALFIGRLNYWLRTPGGLDIDGVHYVYKTHAEWLAELPLLVCRRTSQRVVEDCVAAGLLLTKPGQNTKYYALDYAQLRQMMSRAGMEPSAWMYPPDLTSGKQLSMKPDIEAMEVVEQAWAGPGPGDPEYDRVLAAALELEEKFNRKER